MKRFPHIFASFVLAAVLAAPFAAADSGKKAPKPEKIAHGSKVDIKEHLVAGKTTIVDFTSDYCPPCRYFSPLLDELHATRDDLAVLKVDINRPDVRGIDWNSPVVEQYGIRSVPHFKVFGPDGKLMAEGDAARDMVVKWLGLDQKQS